MAKSIYPIEIEALGITIPLEGDWTPSKENIWDAVKQTVDPKDMFSAYHRGEKEFVRNAARNGYFKGGGLGEGLKAIWDLGWDGVSEVGTGIAASKKADVYRYHYEPFDQLSATGKLKPHEGMFTFENEKGEVRDLRDHAESLKKGGVYLQGLLEAAPVGKWDAEGLMKEAIAHSGMGWWPNQKDVRRWITTYMTDHDKARGRATTYKGAGNIIYGYPMMGEMAGAWFSQAWLDDEEQIDNWIETYEKVNKLEEGRQRSAQQVAMQVGDMETFRKLRAEEVEPREGAAFLAEIVLDPANVAGGLVAKGVTAPVRASLTSAVKSTLLGLQDDLIKQGALQGRKIALNKVAIPSGEVSARRTATEAALAEVNKSIAAREKTLAKYGGKGFVGRLTGSPVSVLAAEEALDLTTDAGKRAAWMARDALAPRAPKTLVSQLTGGGMQALGAPMEILGRTAMYIRQMPENALLAAIQKVTARELTEQEAKSILLRLTAVGGGGYAYLEEGDVGTEILGALAVYIGPKALATVGRDMRVIGHELSLARSTDPFLRRLGALPTPAEGLAGAAKDRTNVLTQGFWQATKAAATDPAKLPFRGAGMEAVGQTPYLGAVPKGVARFLDRTGTGRWVEGAGRFGEAMAEGAILPAGIGYVGAGGDPVGAVVGAAISTPFTSIGAGLGKFANYRNKGDLIQKQLGDVEYYRDHLTPVEKKEFDAMPVGVRMALSEYSLSNPDLIYRGESWGKGGGRGSHQVLEEGPVATYNKDAETPMGPVFAHESSHHMETHGLTAQVNRIMFGDAEMGIAGVYVKRNAKGDPVYLKDADGNLIYDDVGRQQWELTDEFHKLRDDYMTKLRRTRGLKPEEMEKYEQSPELIGRELFAEMGSGLQLSGKLQKHLDKGPIGKLMEGVAKVIFGKAFTKNLMLKLGVAIDKKGQIVQSAIFKNLQRVPEIDALIKKYKRDTAGKTKGEIEEAFPITEEFEQSFSVKDQSDPNVVDVMNTGGVFKTNPDGSIKLDVMRRPIRMTEGEIKVRDEAASKHALEVLEKHGVPIEEVAATVKGVDVIKKSATFKNLTEEMIDDLAKGPWHPRQIETLRNVARALREGDGGEAGFLLGYFSASRGRKPKALPYKLRTAFPYQFKLTQGGNIMVELLDPSILTKNLKYLQKRFPKEAAIFDSDSQIWDDLRIYTANQVAGRPGPTGLGDEKAVFLNALLGGFTKAQVELNPLLREIGYKIASSNNPRGKFGVSIRTFRLDRIFSSQRTGEGMLFDYRRAERLMMPRMDDETVPLPFIEDLGGEEPAAGFKRVATQKMRKADFERFQKPLSRAEAQEAMGNQSQVQEFQPRFPKGERQFMPASDSPDLPYKVSTRNPTAVNASENPLTSDLVIGLEAIEADPKMLHSHAFALQEYPGVKRTSRSPKVIAEKFIDHVVDNLLWLYDQVAPEVRERSRLWYDGARRIVDRWSEEFGSPRIKGVNPREKQGIAAALAALSPQKDWFMNVDLARRILDVMTFKKREKFDSAMVDKYVEKFSESLGRKEASKIANAMKGKTLEELPTNYEQAAFIRAYDEVYNPREYQIVSPEGDFIGISRNQNGESNSVAWGSMSEIAKAVRVLRDPSHRNISEALGNAHKIRNFYNNILLPKADKLSVTIDTHAIAAALLRALAGADLEVANNFGTKPKGAKRSIKNSSVTGIQGTYGIYADAYRKAAEARGVLPREMQSITWEAIRGLFEAKWKTKGNKAKVDNLWKKYENGSLTLNETRKAILDLAEGIKDPEWVGRRSNRGTDESLGAPENAQQLPRPELGRQELRPKPRGRVSDTGDVPPEVGRQFMPAGEGRSRAARPPPRGNRFMAPASKRVAEEAQLEKFLR